MNLAVLITYVVEAFMTAAAFKPAWWLPGPHLQTLWPTFAGRGKKIALQRERIELSDGDFIDIDWTTQTTGPRVLVLHGLEGSVNSPYAQGILKALSRQGWRSGVMHFRGCSGEVNRLPRTYHSGDTSDLAAIIALLQKREPNSPLAVIGFSIGGNVLLKWLGETQGNNPLAAAVAVSVPFQLNKSVDRLREGFSRVYEKHLLRCLCRKMAEKFETQSAPIPLPSLASLQTIRQFDNEITAPLHGFSSAEDYYVQSSSRQFLKSIQVPTLVLHAKDDPFMPASVIPEASELSAAITLEVLPKGGHVGFVGGSVPWRPQYWLDERIPAFLRHYLLSR
jgi:predicted alpha/beta-fold hydrolase